LTLEGLAVAELALEDLVVRLCSLPALASWSLPPSSPPPSASWFARPFDLLHSIFVFWPLSSLVLGAVSFLPLSLLLPWAFSFLQFSLLLPRAVSFLQLSSPPLSDLPLQPPDFKRLLSAPEAATRWSFDLPP
jgi:hypothetical protein